MNYQRDFRMSLNDYSTLSNCTIENDLPFLIRYGVINDSVTPALMPVIWDMPAFFVHYASDKKMMSDVIQVYLLQLLLKSPTNRLQIKLLDTGLSNSFEILDQIRLKTNRKAVDVISIYDNHTFQSMLQQARERKTLLAQSGFQTWKLFQENANVEPFLILSIDDITNFIRNSDLFESLYTLAKDGARLGILVWSMLDVEKLMRDTRESEQERYMGRINDLLSISWGINYDHNNAKIRIENHQWQEAFDEFNYRGITLEKPIEDHLNIAVKELTERYVIQNQESGVDFLKVPVGTYQTQPYYFRMGQASNVYHGMIAGMIRSGKSAFLNLLITRSCEQYTPEQLQFFLFDYRDGVGFGVFHDLAHVPVLHLDNDDHAALFHYLDLFEAERKARAEKFRNIASGITHIIHYNQIAETKNSPKLPYWVMIIDEVQTLFENSETRRKVSEKINDLARKGGAFGLHMLLASQTYRDVNLPTGALGQFGLRVSFKLANAMDCRSILGSDNEVPMSLPRYHAVFNDNCGNISSNKVVSLDYVPEQEIDERLNTVRRQYPYQIDPRFIYRKDISNENAIKSNQDNDDGNTNVPKHWR